MRKRHTKLRLKGGISRRQLLKTSALGLMAGLDKAGSTNDEDLQTSSSCRIEVPGTGLAYYLVPFNKRGDERKWADGTVTSQIVLRELSARPITDVFIFSHGWQGDVREAKAEYANWISAMAACRDDISAMQQYRPNFMPLLVGVHWPSLPCGDEELRAAAGSTDYTAMMNCIAECVADTVPARRASQVILEAAQRPEPDSLPQDVVRAFIILHQQAGLQDRGVAGRPGNDSKRFDPQKLYKHLKSKRNAAAIGAGTAGEAQLASTSDSIILLIIRNLSFAVMKDRGRLVGETGVHQFLRRLQMAAPPKRDVNFHLMGHSFGCIVMSAALAGPNGNVTAIRPVKSLSLIQGALSIWSYTSSIPYSPAQAGYFLPMLRKRSVAGSIVTTQSVHDRALHWWYPLAAQYYDQLPMAGPNAPEYPEYAGVGAWGIQGEDCKARNLKLLPSSAEYGFLPGAIYNIESSDVIRTILGFATGAHSDIAHPEIAHLVWQAAQVKLPEPQPSPPPEPRPEPVPPPPSPPCVCPPAPRGPIRRMIARRRARRCG
jgi:hypothetical protein